jgi:hypothetical protein
MMDSKLRGIRADRVTLRPFRRDLVLIGVVAFVVRVAFVILQTRFAIFDVAFVATDSQLYVQLADAIRSGAGFSVDGRPTAYVGPAYPMFLAVLRAAGLDTLGVGVAQSLLGALTACFAAATAAYLPAMPGSRVPRRGLVFGAGVICALYPHFVFWTGYVLTETLFVCLVASSLLLLCASAINQRIGLAFASGLLAAVAMLTRAPFLAVALVLVCWVGYGVLRREIRPAVATLFALGLALPILGWTVRNVVELGAPVVTTTHSGWVFYQANSAGSTGGSGGYLGDGDFVPLDPPAGLDEVHTDSFYLARTIDDIKADPMAFAARTGPKVWNMWRPTYEGASLRNGVLTLITYVPLLLLGVLGSVALAGTRPRTVGAVPLLILVTWFLLHAVVGGLIRYRLPAELVLGIAAPFGIALLVRPTRPVVPR